MLVSSCRENAVGPIPAPAPTPYSRGPSSLETSTLPLQIGNQWAYIDSDYVGGVSAVRVENVVGVAYDNGVYRYELQTMTPSWDQLGQILYLYCRRDSVFLANPNIYSIWGAVYLPSFAGADTATIYYVWPTRVFALGHPFTTAIGVFDSVFVYESGQPGDQIRHYFKPGLGVLGAEVYYNSVVRQRINLIHVALNHYPPDPSLPPAN